MDSSTDSPGGYSLVMLRSLVQGRLEPWQGLDLTVANRRELTVLWLQEWPIAGWERRSKWNARKGPIQKD